MSFHIIVRFVIVILVLIAIDYVSPQILKGIYAEWNKEPNCHYSYISMFRALSLSTVTNRSGQIMS